MKKFLVFLLLITIGFSASARKSYITVYFPYGDGTLEGNYDIILTGDVPDNIAGLKYVENGQYYYNDANISPHYTLGGILNVLTEYGYEVEFATDERHLLLSKEISSNQTVTKGDLNTDGEVTISDVNELINIILGYVREHPNLLEQYGK